MQRRKLGDLPLKWIGVVGLLLIWLIVGFTPLLDDSSIPALPETFGALIVSLGDPAYWVAIGSTLLTWLLSLTIGTIVGVALGLFAGLNATVQRSIAIPTEFFKTIPVIAVLPLGILVLGTGPTMRITLTAFAVIWPLLVQTLYGVRSIDPMIQDTTRSLGIRPVRSFFTVMLPSASPYIATGIRVAAAMALVITIVIELIAGGKGLGSLISNASLSGVSAFPKLYALIFTAGVIGVLLAGGLSMLEQRLLGWHTTYRRTEVNE